MKLIFNPHKLKEFLTDPFHLGFPLGAIGMLMTIAAGAALFFYTSLGQSKAGGISGMLKSQVMVQDTPLLENLATPRPTTTVSPTPLPPTATPHTPSPQLLPSPTNSAPVVIPPSPSPSPSPTPTPTPTPPPLVEASFTGTLTYSNCPSQFTPGSHCIITVDDRVVHTTPARTPSLQLGQQVAVYAQKLSETEYTLEGSGNYYIRAIN